MDLFQKYRDEVLEPDYFALLYDPEFIKVKGLYLLTAHLGNDSLSRWLENSKYLQTPEKLENTINHIHLDDLVENEKKQQKIGKVLQQKWLNKLAKEFPDQEFEVNLSPLEDGGWELQMWAKRDKNEKIARSKAG